MTIKQTSLRRAKPQSERCAKVFHRSLADSSAGSGIRARWQDIFLESRKGEFRLEMWRVDTYRASLQNHLAKKLELKLKVAELCSLEPLYDH